MTLTHERMSDPCMTCVQHETCKNEMFLVLVSKAYISRCSVTCRHGERDAFGDKLHKHTATRRSEHACQTAIINQIQMMFIIFFRVRK
jgi:hypothetical protein